MVDALKSQRDEPNTLREYELIFILRPNASSDQIQEINTRVRSIVDDAGGKVLRLDNWGKRKLAYEVRKEMKGIYLYWLFLANAGLIHEIERNLRMSDTVIRHFSVKVDEDVAPEARPDQIDDEAFNAAATLVPDEEDAYMGRTYNEDGTEQVPAEGEEANPPPAAPPAEGEEANPPPAAPPAEGEEANPPPAAPPAEGEEAKPAEVSGASSRSVPKEGEDAGLAKSADDAKEKEE